MSPSFLSVVPGAVRVRVRVQPRASRSRIVGQHGGALRAQVTAPPAGGKANEALECLLSGLAKTPRSAARVVRGAKSREKVVEITTSEPIALAARLAGTVSALNARSR